MRTLNERGIAMITTLLVLMLISALLVGFTTIVMSDQRYRFIDRDRGQAFYAASGAIEKLTADLGNTFFSNIAPTGVQMTALVDAAKVPVIKGVAFTTPSAPDLLPGSTLNKTGCNATMVPPTSIKRIGVLGYNLTFCADAAGNPTVISGTNVIKTGPYEGLVALQTPYQIDVTARTTAGGEVHLVRTIESVAIPVFQFGTFSDVDLAFFAGSPFNFGGRVHTNGNLFLSEGGSVAVGASTCPTTSYLTLSGKVTAVGEVVRQRLQNGVSIDTDPDHNGTICMATGSGFRPLERNEGSVEDGLGVGQKLNDPWHNISLSAYNSWIRNGSTGAKTLNLPLLTVGGTNPDLIRRAPVGEAVANNVLFNERLFSKASIRILLSDTAADITNLPTVTPAAPISLGTTVADSNWNLNAPAGIVAPPATVPAGVRAPIARVPGALPANFTVRTQQNAGTWGPTGSPLKVNNLPALFQIPDLIVTKGAVVRPLRCTGRTTNTFTGCVNPATGVAWATGTLNFPADISTAANAVNSTSPTTTMSANWANNTTTITVNSTAAFAQGWFFVTPNGTTTQTLVQCTGYDNSVAASPTLLNCAAWNTTVNPATVYASTANPRLNDVARLYTDALSAAQTSALGGFIKIDRQDANGVWWDVTAEILSYGIAGPNLDGTQCADPTPAAILRLQRLRDNGGTTLAAPNLNGGGCNYAGSTNASDYWPNTLFDPREALFRDVAPADGDVRLGGVMYYIGLDVANLARWFTATAPYNCGAACTGASSKKDNGGFTVYFSDRRNNRKADGTESGEYGFEDFVNPSNAASGAPNGQMDAGEDVNASGGLPETYGATPHYNGGAVPAVAAAPNLAAPLDVNANPQTPLTSPGYAMVNRAILFRRALKLINGSNIRGLGVTGLSVVSENPVYIQGDWNANNAGGAGFTGQSAATAVMADAVTLLSGIWDDANSFANPYVVTQRNRTLQSWYRLAIIGGKGMAFPWINTTPTDFGTDGGAHNFLRYLEDGSDVNGNGATVNYLGATATFFYSRQAVGTYKYGSGIVYNAPTRAYNFDINFNNPALLPPNTPVFRDMNAVGFSQELRPGK